MLGRTQRLPPKEESQCADPVSELLVPIGRLRLALERADLPLELTEDVIQSKHVGVGAFEAPDRPFLPEAMFQNAGSLFDHGTMVLGLGVEEVVDPALSHDEMLLPADAAVREELLYVEKTTVDGVDLVVARPVPVEASGQGDLVQVQRKRPRRVVEYERDLRSPKRRSNRRSGEDDVFHLLRSERSSGLGSHHPRDCIDEIRFTGAIGSDDDGDPRLEFESRPVGERLEPNEFQ